MEIAVWNCKQSWNIAVRIVQIPLHAAAPLMLRKEKQLGSWERNKCHGSFGNQAGDPEVYAFPKLTGKWRKQENLSMSIAILELFQESFIIFDLKPHNVRGTILKSHILKSHAHYTGPRVSCSRHWHLQSWRGRFLKFSAKTLQQGTFHDNCWVVHYPWFNCKNEERSWTRKS